jgi:nucleoside-diphosphate-sugar epimerase
MRVFITGATGFIGSALVSELITNGHHVIGMTRSDAGAEALQAAGAEVHRGDLDDVASLRAGAAKGDAVVHLAFEHNFSDMASFVSSCQKDKQAIEALGAELAGSDRLLIVSGGVGVWAPGQVVTEDSEAPKESPFPRVSEQLAIALRDRGVKTAVVRLPQVHDPVKQGLVVYLTAAAKEKGVSAYVGEGLNRWPAGHVADVARLYRLALEKHEPGAVYHAVGEEGVPLRDIAEVLGRGLNVPVKSIPPEDAAAHFGPFMGAFANFDLPTSSAITQKRLGWKPTGPTLLEDLNQMRFIEALALLA